MINQTMLQYYRSTGSSQVKELLVTEQLPFLENMVRRTVAGLSCGIPFGMDPQDLKAYAVLGLLEAIDHYDPEKIRGFSAFSEKWIEASIRNGIWSFIGAKKSQRRLTILYQIVHDSEEEKIIENLEEPVDRIALAEERMDHSVLRQNLEQEIAALKPAHQRILRRYYYDGCSLREIAKEFGVSHTWVSRLHREALQEIQERIEGNPYLEKELENSPGP